MERWRSEASAYPRVIKASPARKPLKQRKMVPFTRLNLSKSSGRNTFLDCVQYLTHEIEANRFLGKHHYDDSGDKANFDFRAQLVERKKNALTWARAERDRFRYEVLYKGMTIPRQVIEQNPIAYQKR